MPASYNFFDTSASEFLTLALLKHRITKQYLSNFNDGGDNNEKTKNLKTRGGMFKSVGGNFPGGSLMGGNFLGVSFPDTGFEKV